MLQPAPLRHLIALLTIGLFLTEPIAAQVGAGNALDFDGVNDYVEISDHASLNPRDAITVEAWIQPHSFASNIYDNSILCKHNWAAGNAGYVLRCGDGGKVSFIVASRSSGSWVEANSTTTPLEVDKWYHIAGVFDGDSVKVYVNGILQASALYSGQINISSGANARIGQLSTGTGRNFDGIIDEVRLWDTAIDQGTIKRWMCQKLNSGHTYNSHLSAYWKIDEGQGFSVRDTSSQTNHGTVNGATWRGSGAAIGDRSVYSYSPKELSIRSSYGDSMRAYNLTGSPAYMHLYFVNGGSDVALHPNVNGRVDSTHYYGVYMPENSNVDADFSLNYSNYSGVNTNNECGVDLFRRYPGDSTFWEDAKSTIDFNADSASTKDHNISEFSLVFFSTDSNSILRSETGRPWFCSGDSVRLVASGGRDFSFKWFLNSKELKGDTLNYLYVSNSGKYSVEIKRRGTSCTFKSVTMTITEKKPPKVSLSAFSPLCEDTDTLALNGGSPKGGTYYGASVRDTFFFPSALGAGTYPIVYSYTDTALCTSSDTQNVLVWSLPALSLVSVPWTCDNVDSFEMKTVTPSGGIYSGSGMRSNHFHPDLVNGISGLYGYSYTFTDTNGCSNRVLDSIQLRTSTVAILNPIPNSCLNNDPLKLIGLPKGGTFSGTGVNGNEFDPDVAGVGEHEIMYQYVNSVNCPSTNSKVAKVFRGTNVSWSYSGSACVNGDSIDLKEGTPGGGIFAGNGVTDKTFYPDMAGTGKHTIVYIFVDSNQCANRATGSVDVFDTTVLTYSAHAPICPEIDSVELTALSPSGGIYSGNAIGNDLQFYPAMADSGMNAVSYAYVNGNSCRSEYNFYVEVLGVTPVRVELADAACVNDNPIKVQIEPTGGTLKGPGIISTFFSPGSAGAGEHSITYNFTNANGCVNADTAHISVGDIPEVTLEAISSLCADAMSFTLSGGHPIGGMYKLNNAADSVFDPALQNAGEHVVGYVFINEQGCGDSTEVRFWMNELPAKPSITLNDSSLQSSNATTYQWYGSSGLINGADSREFKPEENGDYRVEITNDSGCVNISDVFTYDLISVRSIGEKVLKIYPNPSDEHLIIEFPGHFTANLYSAHGELILEEITGENSITVSTAHLSVGSYLLEIENTKGTLRKVVLIR